MYEKARQEMLKTQIARRGVRDKRVLAAMGEVPREAFVEPGFEASAYEDRALPIAEGQTISQPYVVAVMLAAADLHPGDRVLEVGAGSGYAAAVLSRLVAHVFAIERLPALAAVAEKRGRALGYDNITFRTGDGSNGWPEEAPFDAILVAASGPEPPDALKRQLVMGGRLIMPVEESGDQRLTRLTRLEEAKFSRDEFGGVKFVPLIGAQGWPDTEQS
ncbi:MAG TPA: protein-L-isoaspartate(D-aspartate) O-methyltransferase [Rhizomicrobium sp.]|nr:protein-L-isoaspartate(D-aspartate) O-methyltransferase [Rhizomicrobium sp.]